MTRNPVTLFRSLLVYALCLPLAIFLGYYVGSNSAPSFVETKTLAMLGSALFVLLIPLLLRWHHAWLIATWNMSVTLFFLKGRPSLWMVMVFLSFTIASSRYILNREQRFLNVPSVTRSLIFLSLVIIITAVLTGGVGFRVFGNENYGGKRYFNLVCAMVGYFALTSERIAPEKVSLYAALFVAGGLTNAISELAVFVAPSFYFIFLLFPVSPQGLRTILNDPAASQGLISRPVGFATAGWSLVCTVLCLYRIREIFTLRRVVILVIFLVSLVISAWGGFRSTIILLVLTFGIIFYLEGLMRSRLLPAFILATILGGAFLVGFVDRLPLNVQRSLSFLPLPINPIARLDAQDSTQWRLEMWKNILPEVPKHLLLGKGLTFNAAEMEAIQIGPKLGQQATAGAEYVGDYHNGPLSVIVQFGVLGVIGFVWFLTAALRVLYNNYKSGNSSHQVVNTFLFAYFIARMVFFFTVYGSFHDNMQVFTSLLGLSIAINGGVAKPAETNLEKEPETDSSILPRRLKRPVLARADRA
jgi:hypothetical protein